MTFASLLSDLEWDWIDEHYAGRSKTHKRLIRLHDAEDCDSFAALALGISSGYGNFSAAEHNFGPKVLADNTRAAERLWDLANSFWELESAASVPELIRAAGLRWLSIGVGSELSCMMNPDLCWVVNVRTIWAYLLLKHEWNTTRANEELQLYRLHDPLSDMTYSIWEELHPYLGEPLADLAAESARWAGNEGISPGSLTYLWADAIADRLYADYT